MVEEFLNGFGILRVVENVRFAAIKFVLIELGSFRFLLLFYASKTNFMYS